MATHSSIPAWEIPEKPEGLQLMGLQSVRYNWSITSYLSEWVSSKKKIYEQKMLERVWRKRNPLALLVGMQTDIATVEKSMEIPLKTSNENYHMTQQFHYQAYTLRKP